MPLYHEYLQLKVIFKKLEIIHFKEQNFINYKENIMEEQFPFTIETK